MKNIVRAIAVRRSRAVGRQPGRAGPHAETDQPRDRAARSGSADLLHRLARRDRRKLRAGRQGRADLRRLHQLRHGARAVRRQGAGGLHARPGEGRADQERPSHAGRDRQRAGQRDRRKHRSRQRVDVSSGARDRRARHPSLPRRYARRGARVRRSGADCPPTAGGAACTAIRPRRASGASRPTSTASRPMCGRSTRRASCCSA